MAILQLTHASILNSNAQLLVLPVNNAGVILDPVLTRAKTLFPDKIVIDLNYKDYLWQSKIIFETINENIFVIM